MSEFKEIKFFGRRKGKSIKGSREFLIDNLLPKVQPTLPPQGQKIDLSHFFGIAPKEVWLEVGFGGGEHLAEQSFKHPHVGFIGAEPFMNGVASLLAHLNGTHMQPAEHVELAGGRVDNVRVWPDDVRQLFPFLSDGVFNRVFVLYPDPWPKARHAERRFINQPNLHHLYRLMADDGHLYVATDVETYAEHACEQVQESGLFELVNAQDVRTPPPGWIPTRYEKKGIAAGRRPTYLIFSKKKQKS